MEIERKFLIAEPPGLEEVESDSIEQGYLSVGEDGEVRLRRRRDSLVLTVKRGSGLSREEAEVELDGEQFERLWPLTADRRLAKRRHRLEYDGVEVELDVYEGDLDGLCVAEIEFKSEEDANRFEPPPWLGQEVTGDPAYLNETLATHGAP